MAFHGQDENGDDAIFVGDGDELVVAIREGNEVDTDLGLARIASISPEVAVNLDGVIVTTVDLQLVADGSDIGSATIVAAPAPPIGDLDGDGDVDFDDLVLLLAAWGGE